MLPELMQKVPLANLPHFNTALGSRSNKHSAVRRNLTDHSLLCVDFALFSVLLDIVDVDHFVEASGQKVLIAAVQTAD
jgi:hypothetical protein